MITPKATAKAVAFFYKKFDYKIFFCILIKMKSKDLSPQIIKKIGISFFTCIIIIACALSFFFAKSFIGRYYPVRVQFNFVADLKKGAAIKFVGGPEIGYVKKIYRNKNKIEILLNIKKSFKLREKAEISMFTLGMMGERYIEISQTPYNGNYVKPDSLIIGNDALSFEILQLNMARLSEVLAYSKDDEDKPPKNFISILQGIKNNFRDYTYNINHIRPDVYTNISTFKDNLNTIISKIHNAQKFMEKLNQDLKTISKKDIKIFFSVLYDLDNDINNFNQAMPDIKKNIMPFKKITCKIINEENKIGQLIFDKKDYNDLLDKIEDIEEFSEDIAKNPRNLLFR